jgi:hypothetical protein
VVGGDGVRWGNSVLYSPYQLDRLLEDDEGRNGVLGSPRRSSPYQLERFEGGREGGWRSNRSSPYQLDRLKEDAGAGLLNDEIGTWTNLSIPASEESGVPELLVTFVTGTAGGDLDDIDSLVGMDRSPSW